MNQEQRLAQRVPVPPRTRPKVDGGRLPDGVNDAPLVLDLPVDRLRLPTRSPRPVTCPVAGTGEEAEWAAYFLTFLHRYTGATELVVATPGPRIGVFTVRPDESMAGLIARTSDALAGLRETASIPAADLLAGRAPDIASGHLPAAHASFGDTDLLDFADIGLRITGGEAVLVADGNLWDRPSVERMAGHLAMIAAAEPGLPVSAVPLLDAAERNRVLVEWNDTAGDWDPAVGYLDLFADQVTATPFAPAVVSAGQVYTYAELDVRSNRIARRLRRLGAGPGVHIGLFCSRSADYVVAVLAILKSGAAAAVLDPINPDHRLEFMAADADVPFVLTSEHLLNRVPDGVPAHVVNSAEFDDEPADALPVTATADTVSHLIYTSGSSGEPKAVRERHGALANLVHWTRRAYEVSAGDRASWVSTPGFAVQVMEWMPYLALGAAVHIADEDIAMSADRLKDWIVAEEITHAMLVAVLAERAWQLDWSPASKLRIMVTTAERVHSWPPADKGFTVVMTYGCTEATNVLSCLDLGADVDATTRATPEDVRLTRQVPVGRPIANQRVYVLDPSGEPVPVGVVGRLHVTGAGLSGGYHNRPELTERSFRPSHLPEDPGVTFYDTGDLARYRADGVIELLGRSDDQVKIRGFRVELGEVEAVLAALPAVADVAVVAAEDTGTGRHLVAYVVGADGSELSAESLRGAVAERLPTYMTPSVFVLLDHLPRLPAGKLDLRALPAVDGREHLRTEYAEPRTDIERGLISLWCDTLRLPRVGVHDGFFDLGGHSLLAMQLIEGVRREFGIQLRLSDIHRVPTVAGMAELIVNGHGDRHVDIQQVRPDPAARHEPFPLNDSQQALWVGRGDAVELGNVGCHGYFEWQGDLDVARFETAWRLVVERHAALRTVVGRDGTQRVLAEPPEYRIPVADLRGAGDEESQRRLMEIRDEMSHLVIPDDQWPLFDLRLSRLDTPEGPRVRIHLSLDMLIVDAWSYFQVLVPDLVQFYEDPSGELEPLELTFRDYVIGSEGMLESTEIYRRSRQYWLDRLADLPPAPQLPVLPGRRADGEIRFDRCDHRIDKAGWDRLKQQATRHGVTPSGLLTAVFAEVLRVWSGQDRFTINFPLFNRLPVHPQVNSLIGDTTTTLLLAVEKSDGTFAERAASLQNRLWTDLEHRYFSGVRVLRELAKARSSVVAAMPIVLTSLVGHPPRRFATALGEAIYSISQTPQVSVDFQVFEIEGALQFNWDYLDGLFPDGMVQDMFDAYCGLMHALADDDAWRTERFDLIPPDHRRLLSEVNRTETAVPDVSLLDLFDDQVRLRPDEPAVISARRVLTFAELRSTANRIGRSLRRRGARPNSLVAVVMEKGWEQYAAVYGVLTAGAAYLPVDPRVPVARLHHLLADGQVGTVLTQSWLADSVTWPEYVTVLTIDDFDGIGDSALEPVQTPTDLAYVIYTSGSTGAPKGAMVDHRAVVNHVLDVNRRFGIRAGDRALATAALNFDMSVYDVFGILAAGGAAVVPQPDASPDPDQWISLVATHSVTFWAAVPALMDLVVSRAEAVPGTTLAPLRTVVLAGDWIPLTLPGRLRALAPGVSPISCGGPTETTNWSIAYPIGEISQDWTSIPYGKPMANHRYLILDQHRRECPLWVAGEMYVVSEVGLAQGYWRDEDRTAAAFVRLPDSGERAYATGDLGRYLPDGTVEILGRVDFQVKVQGHRIELGEVEAALRRHPAVAQVAVVAIGEHAERRLAAHIVPTEAGAVDAGELRRHAGSALAASAVPAVYHFHAELPLSRNGKVDRAALADIQPAVSSTRLDPAAAPTPVERLVADLWGEVLGVPEVGPGDRFFDLGGNSMLAATIAQRLGELFDVDVPLRTIFTLPTPADVAAELVSHPDHGAEVTAVAQLLQDLSEDTGSGLAADPT
ncbi:amino acid adenylation domain-containing protein [Amycolatopsis sp. cmx-11-12]|uniref:amino acid adenylation domain-containing protein n=1 Tax=Amycolatopsis sp. cmx-11-12 TaxID=2785795 RepID=UPI003916FDE2